MSEKMTSAELASFAALLAENERLRVFVGNGMDADGSLRALCCDLAAAVQPVIARLIAEARAEGERIGRERERAEIVAWLRTYCQVMTDASTQARVMLTDATDSIEAGDHISEATQPPTPPAWPHSLQ